MNEREHQKILKAFLCFFDLGKYLGNWNNPSLQIKGRQKSFHNWRRRIEISTNN